MDIQKKDIVERLRGYRPDDDGLWSAIVDASYEIERLRAELKWIADTPMQWTKPQGDIYWANVAVALAQKAMNALGHQRGKNAEMDVTN